MSDLQERGAWTGSSIDYRTDGLHVLATEEVSEIDAALDHLHGLGDLDFPQITAATFPLPTLGGFLRGLRDELRCGRGGTHQALGAGTSPLLFAESPGRNAW